MAISIIFSACGNLNTTTGSGSGGSSTPTTLGTPGSYNCVSGALTISGSTALQPLVTKVACA